MSRNKQRKLPTSDKSTQSKKQAAGRKASKQAKPEYDAGGVTGYARDVKRVISDKTGIGRKQRGGEKVISTPPKKKAPEPEVVLKQGGKTYK